MAVKYSAVNHRQWRGFVGSCIGGALIASGGAQAADESRDDAWWTGPMTAASGAVLPQGHMLVEPYLYDAVATGRIDSNGTRESAAGEHDLGSLTYLLYGLTDRVTVGIIPRFGINQPDGQSAGSGIGDTTLQAGFGLTRYSAASGMPDISIVLDETLPTGRFDRLSRPSEGLGSGAYTSGLSVYTQEYFWAPTGRIVRTRLDLTYSLSSSPSLRDQSVYGTPIGFQGEAHPGASFTADAAAEYSVTRHWVAALDVIYQHGANTRVAGGRAVPGDGTVAISGLSSDSGSSYLVGFAPAIEYNWNGSVGILMGVRVFEIGRNIATTITPVIALNVAL
ncbi:MAG: transporter [Steroidobacteraceae bacterium]